MHTNETKYYHNLAAYFTSQPHFFDGAQQKKPHIRKCMELPFQQTKARLWDEVTDTLCNLEFMPVKAGAFKIKHRGVLKTPSGLKKTEIKNPSVCAAPDGV